MSSLFSALLDLLEAGGPLRVSFDDLTGFSLDYQEMAIATRQTSHTCDFCVFAKRLRGGLSQCVANKYAANRIALRRREGFGGLCHLGQFDLVEPLIVRGKVLGVFYYGSVAVNEWRALQERRIKTFCFRKGLDPEPYLRMARDSPGISKTEIPTYQKRLRTIATTVAALCDAFGVAEKSYDAQYTSIHKREAIRMPHMVRSALQYVAVRYAQPCHVQDIAAALRCNPDYLSRVFKSHTRMELSAYVQHVRIDHAKGLLKQGLLRVSEVSDRCGFSDTSHFVKVFKRLVGITPADYSRNPSGPDSQTS